MKIYDWVPNQGGRVVWFYTVAGLPYIFTSSSTFDVTSYISESKLKQTLMGDRRFDTGDYDADNCQWVHGVLRVEDKIEYKLDDENGVIDGGHFRVKIDRKHRNIDNTSYNWPATVVGIPGVDFVPDIGVTSGIKWGYLDGTLKRDDDSFYIIDQTNGGLHSQIQTTGGCYLWIGTECLWCDDSTSLGSGQYLIQVDEGSVYDTGRGCLRTREHGHYKEITGGSPVVVSNMPLGSISGRACYLWMTVVDDDGDIILDEGTFCMAHGRVQPGVSISDTEISIPCEHWLNHLKQDITVRFFSGNLKGYMFSRGSESFYSSGTTTIGTAAMKAGFPSDNALERSPHLIVKYAGTGTYTYHLGIWLCDTNTSVWFPDIDSVIDAVNVELSRCYWGSADQATGGADIVGDGGPSIWVGDNGSGRRIIRCDDPDNTEFGGPLAWLFGLCDASKSDVEYCSQVVNQGIANNIPTPWELICEQYWSIPWFRQGDYIENPTEGIVNHTAPSWSPVLYYYQTYGLLDESVGMPYVTGGYQSLSHSTKSTKRAFPVPLYESNHKVFVTGGSDVTALSSGDIVQIGNPGDDNFHAPRCMRLKVSSAITSSTTGESEIRIGQTGDSEFTDGYNNESIVAYDPKNSPIGPCACVYWCGTFDESDPWAMSTSGIAVKATSLSALIRAILGITTTPQLAEASIIDWIPDVNDSDPGQLETIDWTSFADVMKPLMSGHTYVLALSEEKFNLYKALQEELKLHGAMMTLEPDATLKHFVLRFRKRGDVNVTTALLEGRVIDSSNIVAYDRQQTRHNDAWRYSQVSAKTNWDGKESKLTFKVDSKFARSRLGGVFSLEIDAKISRLPINAQNVITSDAAETMYTHFVPLLVSSSRDKPVVSKKLTQKAFWLINLGLDAVITDSTIANIHTGAIGVTSKPCTVKRLTYNFDENWGLDVGLAMSTNGTYGWAPAMRVDDGNADITTLGASGEITIEPNLHDFSRIGDRTDLSHFRNYTWNKATKTYTLGESDPAYKVIVVMENDVDFTPVAGTIDEVNLTAPSAVLNLSTATIPYNTTSSQVTFTDSDMEQAGTSYWTITSGSGTLSKQTPVAPSGSGSNVLRVTPSGG